MGGSAHRLFAPGTADGYNLFAMEGKLLLKTLWKKGQEA